MRPPRVLFLITEDWYFWSHRRLLAQHLLRNGYHVDVVTSCGQYRSRIEAAGMHHHSVGLVRGSKHPWREAQAVFRLIRLFRHLQPDIVHLVGMKPMLYGSLAARLSQVPATVCAVAGLGWLFSPGGIIKRFARFAVRSYFRHLLCNRNDTQFIVQNRHHRDVLVTSQMATNDQITLIRGAGVDVQRFAYVPETDGPPTVVLHGRMLRDKGIEEFVQAARTLQREALPCRFLLVGDPDAANPTSIPVERLQMWREEGVVQWQPRCDDVPRLLASSHIACLPSYHEGFPLALVEAAACGRAIVASDIPGCRDVVADGQSGLLVPVRNVPALVAALRRLIFDPALRHRMGRKGRERVMKDMSSTVVNADTLACYERLLARGNPLQHGPRPTFVSEAA